MLQLSDPVISQPKGIINLGKHRAKNAFITQEIKINDQHTIIIIGAGKYLRRSFLK
jgi:hypothetical protein